MKSAIKKKNEVLWAGLILDWVLKRGLSEGWYLSQHIEKERESVKLEVEWKWVTNRDKDMGKAL